MQENVIQLFLMSIFPWYGKRRTHTNPGFNKKMDMGNGPLTAIVSYPELILVEYN